MVRRLALPLVLAGLATGCSESVNGDACPYGVNSGASNSSSSSSCKVRPAPDEAQRAAVDDGSAWRRARAAFAKSPDARASLVGIGLNRWGDVTFTRAEGDGEARLVTYDRSGEKAAQDVPSTRGYVESRTDDPFELRDAPAAGLAKVLARVRRAAPDFAFSSAGFGTTVSGAQRRWTISATGGGGGGGLVVFARGDGSRACAFPERRGDLPACDGGALLPSGAGDAPPGAPDALPEAPSAPSATLPPEASGALDQAQCVARAAGDVEKIQRCIE